MKSLKKIAWDWIAGYIFPTLEGFFWDDLIKNIEHVNSRTFPLGASEGPSSPISLGQEAVLLLRSFWL